jgi:hypothetical protein
MQAQINTTHGSLDLAPCGVILNINGKGGDFPFIRKEKDLADRSLVEVNRQVSKELKTFILNHRRRKK